jgi:hypothetical protein
MTLANQSDGIRHFDVYPILKPAKAGPVEQGNDGRSWRPQESVACSLRLAA